ncbi:MAG: hypothetical protein ABW034_00200 [Steroidobacteraceae bacterium]
MIFEYPSWSTPLEQQRGLLTVALITMGLSLAYSLWLARKERSLWPLFVFLGAGCSVFYEPLGDILTKVAYPPLDELRLLEAFGRVLPLWMGPNYFFFFCVPVLLLLNFVVKEGVAPRRWWMTYIGLVLFVTVFEQPGIKADAWRYYGSNQALSLNTYPLWVGFVNAQSLFVMASGVYGFRRLFHKAWHSVLLILLMPTLLVASHVGISWPVSSALYSTDNVTIVNSAALLTVVMCFVSVAACLQALRPRTSTY